MHHIINAYNGIGMVPELSRLNSMVAVHFYSLNQPPEEEALTAALQYANTKGLTEQTSRLFGRNIYLTDKPEPHGYEYLLTADKIQPAVEIEDVVSGGLYAVSEVKNLFTLTEGWNALLKWVETNGYKPVGVKKGLHGWVNSAYEELLDWQQQKPPTEWRFRLWVQLKE
jgi:hypothetical protein